MPICTCFLPACASCLLPLGPYAPQSVMEAYFEQRQGRLAREGLGALQRSMAGIYYLPFLTGASLHFRFAGQSIPNRCACCRPARPLTPCTLGTLRGRPLKACPCCRPHQPMVLHASELVGHDQQLVYQLQVNLPASPAGRSDVRAECGVKIFFDVVSAETRAAAARELAVQVCALPLARPFCSWPGWRSEPSRWSFVLRWCVHYFLCSLLRLAGACSLCAPVLVTPPRPHCAAGAG